MKIILPQGERTSTHLLANDEIQLYPAQDSDYQKISHKPPYRKKLILMYRIRLD